MRRGDGSTCLSGSRVRGEIVDLAKQAGLTLVGRAKGKRFTALAGTERLVFDHDPDALEDEDPRHQRKSGRADDAA